MTPIEPQERQTIWLFCLIAVIHVFVYSCAFPLFSCTDEESHFDMAIKYSHAQPPRALDKLCDETMDYYVIYCTQEYVQVPPDGGGYPPPLWASSAWISDPIKEARRKLWNDPNHESTQPPLYYIIAGAWWRTGQLLGFHDGFLIYWLRFLNLPVVVALVWLGYAAARLVFPAEKFLRLSLPAMLACFPQPVFYSIQNDMLCAVTFGSAFLLLLKMDLAIIPPIRLASLTGLALAATFLTKSSNLPLLFVAMLFIGLIHWRLIRDRKLVKAAPGLLAFSLSAFLPMAAWMAWCKYNFGDLLGVHIKTSYLGWTGKPLSEWLSHPIFTPHGFTTFYTDLWSKFWQGELLWHRVPMAPPVPGLIYILLTTLVIILAFVHLRTKAIVLTLVQRHALWFALWAVLGLMAFLGFLSIIYDFHNCFYPSRSYPYFTSGRLMVGMLIPFMLLFLFGLDRSLVKWGCARLRSLAVAGLIAFMLCTELATDLPVFASEYNWFHLQNHPSVEQSSSPVPHVAPPTPVTPDQKPVSF